MPQFLISKIGMNILATSLGYWENRNELIYVDTALGKITSINKYLMHVSMVIIIIC